MTLEKQTSKQTKNKQTKKQTKKPPDNSKAYIVAKKNTSEIAV